MSIGSVASAAKDVMNHEEGRTYWYLLIMWYERGMGINKRGGGWFWRGFFSAVIGALAVWHFTGKPRSPRLTKAALAGAKLRWTQAGIRDYSMNITVGGRENARHRLWWPRVRSAKC